ncbi:isoprenylcysteine carboxylmethyltransferase family protein [Agriterribacter sp.]|uniref:methyltransferase family protein n=1 Tax=Agriterribacter sp. TaxID=2821509 RepID=UPI002BC802AB|nr:isoprenylcysteine carboxylmethyltransferase family protein [Agriterribacter sp.]HRO47646.1 isoprenylcysteine carboxylmethyltransferase family protein [Agriterribacter sp.]HRQ17631.1 isoprenylcysteine carboxylmethyltransferase family protein [Agriterribacter sp.]
MKRKDHPGVYIPPPLIYVAFFFLSVVLQKWLPLNSEFLYRRAAKTAGWILIAAGVLLVLPAVWKFFVSKNTVITVKPARSLQTTGIYRFTRNPMYLGLLLLYCGTGVFKGNWWTFMVIPLLIMTIQLYVIRKEERYLRSAFGNEYLQYKQKVRRWV